MNYQQREQDVKIQSSRARGLVSVPLRGHAHGLCEAIPIPPDEVSQGMVLSTVKCQIFFPCPKRCKSQVNELLERELFIVIIVAIMSTEKIAYIHSLAL